MSKTNFTMTRNLERDTLVFHLELSAYDMQRARLTPFDKLLLADCEQSDLVSDKLLALERIVRLIEEGYEAKNRLQSKRELGG